MSALVEAVERVAVGVHVQRVDREVVRREVQTSSAHENWEANGVI